MLNQGKVLTEELFTVRNASFSLYFLEQSRKINTRQLDLIPGKDS